MGQCCLAYWAWGRFITIVGAWVGFVLVVTGASVGVGAWGVCYRSFRSVGMGVGAFCKHDCWKRGGVFYSFFTSFGV